VPNALALFTPIILEHVRYLGPSVERIAWHKAGIIKPHSYAYSLPQSPQVMQVLSQEAEKQNATFEWLAPMDMGRFVASTENGMRVDFGRYGIVDMPMLGRYEIENASLAIWAAGNIHARLPLNPPLSHRGPEYLVHIREGLESILWPGRCQQLQDKPQVFIDGAINTTSAQSFIESVRHRLTQPVVTILAVPRDRDYPAVYPMFAPISQSLILTETDRNITIKFPEPEAALAEARKHHADVTYQPNVAAALDAAKAKTGEGGTVLMAVAQPVIGDTMALYGLVYEQI